MIPYNVLIKPVLSEKSVEERDKRQKYTFVVARKATKSDIKRAIETVFEDVRVKNVNTAITRGKLRRRGMRYYRTATTKKALVTLMSGQKIKIFDNE